MVPKQFALAFGQDRFFPTLSQTAKNFMASTVVEWRPLSSRHIVESGICRNERRGQQNPRRRAEVPVGGRVDQCSPIHFVSFNGYDTASVQPAGSAMLRSPEDCTAAAMECQSILLICFAASEAGVDPKMHSESPASAVVLRFHPVVLLRVLLWKRETTAEQ